MKARRTRLAMAIVSIAAFAAAAGVLLAGGTGNSEPADSPAPAVSSLGRTTADGATTSVRHGGADASALWRLLIALPPADREALVAGLTPELRADLRKITEGVAAAVNSP